MSMFGKESKQVNVSDPTVYNSRYHFIAERVATVVQGKNSAYGDAFAESEKFFRLLFPDGIPAERLGDALFLVRIWDKLKRFATGNDPAGENPIEDVIGYALNYLEKKERGVK